jgi:hypothetical protein
MYTEACSTRTPGRFCAVNSWSCPPINGGKLGGVAIKNADIPKYLGRLRDNPLRWTPVRAPPPLQSDVGAGTDGSSADSTNNEAP